MLYSVILLVLEGCSWIVVGAFVGLIGRRNIDLSLFQTVNSAFALIVTAALALFNPEGVIPPAGIPARTWVLVVTGVTAFGLFNYVMIEFMGRAMSRGPNSVVWAIIQSGLIFPFLMGTFVFGEPMGVFRAVGIVLILASVVMYSIGKNGAEPSASKQSGSFISWFVPALLGMLCCGINQCAASLPSFVERGNEFPAAFRTFFCYIGILIPGGIVSMRRALAARASGAVYVTRGQMRMILIIASAEFIVGYLGSVFLQFPGLDGMKACGRGAMGYPIMVASCIAGFFPYGVLFLHEKVSPIQAVGAVVGIAGILLGCL